MLGAEVVIMKIKNRVNYLNYLIVLLVIAGLIGMRVANSSCPELLDHEFPKLQDNTPQNLCMYKNSVVLVVNTASFCGFTKQYEGLENLYKNDDFHPNNSLKKLTLENRHKLLLHLCQLH